MSDKDLLQYLRCADLPDEAIQLKSFLIWHSGIYDRYRRRLTEQKEAQQ